MRNSRVPGAVQAVGCGLLASGGFVPVPVLRYTPALPSDCLRHMVWIEAVAVVFGFLAVLLTVRQHVACWPAGLVQVTLYVAVFYDARLYSDLILHVIYIGVQLYGWHHWLHGGRDHGELRVSRLPTAAFLSWMAVCAVGTVVWGTGMATWTDASFPYGDAFTTVTSLVAMWLQARKKIETWAFWIVVDVVAIVIYLAKGLYLTSGLYLAFMVLCVMGLAAWRRVLVAT